MKGKKAGSSGRSADLTMAESTGVEQIVEKVVSQVLDNHVPELRSELVRRVLEELPQASASSAASASGESGAANLLKAIAAIQSGTTQREILRALLDNTVRYSGRAALFVIKAGAATGWQGRGFTREGEDTIKDFALNVTVGVPEQALRSRMPFSGKTQDIDPEFVAKFGAPADEQLLLLPLLLKEKVAALVYADAGVEGGGKLDSPAVELLVLVTSAWLEVASLRKQAQKEESAEAPGEKAESAAPAAAAPSHSDPFAAHAPKHVAPVAETMPPPQVEVEPPVAVAQAEPVITAAAAAPAPAADPFANLSPEDADVHRKAQRFARLLVDEIKLYNQVKVSEGRKNKDLYDRLKEDIEKSRITYQKRYGNTAAGGADYFSQELVRSLAEDDTSIMGANFRRN
ncbi:MAG TPA: hypothetical protein VEU11_07725 [Terriglobales bacterium]|jgi:hypothetical protein|nr:hypothetical protein [Terriglobales bacterium]